MWKSRQPYPDVLKNPEFCKQLGEALSERVAKRKATTFIQLLNDMFIKGASLEPDPDQKDLKGAALVHHFLSECEPLILGRRRMPRLLPVQRELVYKHYLTRHQRERATEFDNLPVSRRIFNKKVGRYAGGMTILGATAGSLAGIVLPARPEDKPAYQPYVKAKNALHNAKMAKYWNENKSNEERQEIEKKHIVAEKALLDAKDAIEKAGLPSLDDAERNYSIRNTILSLVFMIGIIPSSAILASFGMNMGSKLFEDNNLANQDPEFWRAPAGSKKPDYERLSKQHALAMKNLRVNLKKSLRVLEEGIDPFLKKVAVEYGKGLGGEAGR